MVAHRANLRSEVFLGEDNSVKLGDFGLSKLMQSHDFASTYVGTPFYMSPEICAAEKYTLKSDIWSLGCIIYELCSREPPFNAKSHFQLVQKIKEGKVAPLPAVYSSELMGVIKDCLRVNPDRRPDTVALLNLPVVRLMRKEKEVVDFGKMLKTKEETLDKRIREATQNIERSKAAIRTEIDNQLRREWEVKARLEIDRHVQREIEELQRKFEHEVQARVKLELENHKKTVTFDEQQQQQQQEFSSSNSKSDYPSSFPNSSIGAASADGEFPSTTDITDMSDDMPEIPAELPKKNTRTPFGRAQTMFPGAVGAVGTPMDVEMASPSPMAIASLALSPRRTGMTKPPSANTENIFAANQAAPGAAGSQWDELRDSSLDMNSDSEEEGAMPSPSRNVRSNRNPFTSKQRPNLPVQKPTGNVHFISKMTGLPIIVNQKPSNSDLQGQAPSSGLRRTPSNRALQDRSGSPSRRLSKIPSAANLTSALQQGSGGSDGAPVPGARKSSLTKKDDTQQTLQQPLQQPPPSSSKAAASKNNNIRGRTLVELQQARAGGRPMSAVLPGELINPNVSPKRAFREHAAAGNRGTASEPVAVWDPEKDDMPSPFLVRRKPVTRALRGDVPVLSFQ